MAPAYQGLLLPSHKRSARAVAITQAPVPDQLVLLLDQHGMAPLQPCVSSGERVLMGQVIARGESELAASLHAPVSGQVRSIESQPSTRNGQLAQAIIIDNDHRDARDESLQPLPNWIDLSPLALCEHLARGGVVGLGGAVFSTATKLATQRRSIDCVLINGIECEPYICCDDRLMRERATQIVQGIQILMHAAQATRCIIAIEADKPEALAAMRAASQAAADERIAVQAVPPAYPSGDEGRMIAQLLNREIPREGLPADVGVMVYNVATAYACAQWLLHAQPLISRVLTVTGPAIDQPANLEVRIGTRISDLLTGMTQQGSNRIDMNELDTLIMGGAMMGRTLTSDQLPVVKACNCLVLAQHVALKAPTVEMPCIRCGECAEACPAYLLPQQLLFHIRAHNALGVQQLGLKDCIECGCCDYVCPSNITLAARFHAAKHDGVQ